MKKIALLIVVVACIIIGIFPVNVKAQDSTAYTIQKIPSGNEIVETSSFFDLLLEANQKKTIQVLVRNTSSREITVKNQIFTAFTNENGEIDYTRNPPEFDRSLKTKMSDIAQVKASDILAVIPVGQERVVSADIQVPADVSSGVILGSWHFQEEKPAEEEESASQGVRVNSHYAYSLAIKITIDKEASKPTLNLLGITTGMVNYRKAFLAQLQNETPALLTRVKIEGRVTKKGEFDTLYEHTFERADFAPNSNFNFPVFLGEDQIKAGEYTYRIRAVTQDIKEGFTGQSWEWNQDFTVLPQEAAQVNSSSINDGMPPTPSLMDYLKQYWWIAGIAVSMLIFFFILLFKRRKKDEEDENEKIRKEAIKLFNEMAELERK